MLETQPVGESSSTLDRMAREFVRERIRANPTWATALGIHDQDSILEQMSREAIKAETARIARRTDRQILLDAAESALIDLAEIRTWARDPCCYLELVGSSLLLLVKREFAPAQLRAASLLGRLGEVPRILRIGSPPLRRVPEILEDTA